MATGYTTKVLWEDESIDNTTIYAKFYTGDCTGWSITFEASATNSASAVMTFWAANIEERSNVTLDETSDDQWTEITSLVNDGTAPDLTSVTSAAVNESLSNFVWIRVKIVCGDSTGSPTLTARACIKG